MYRNFGFHLLLLTQTITKMPQKYESLSSDSSEDQGSELTENGLYTEDSLNDSRKEQRLRRRLVFAILALLAICAILAFRVFSLELQRHQKSAGSSCEYFDLFLQNSKLKEVRLADEHSPTDFTSSERTVLFMPDEAFNPVNHTKESDDAWLTMHSRK
jgi:hypothetical protein